VNPGGWAIIQRRSDRVGKFVPRRRFFFIVGA
jgi:hypothetical protein